MADAVAIPIKGEHGDKAHSGSRGKKDLMEGDAPPRSNREFNCTKAYSVDARSTEALNGMRGNGHQCLKVGAFRGNMTSGPSIQYKGVLCEICGS
jgi:hypothetical protein